MWEMIQEYERCRAALSSRIHELNTQLRENPMLRTKEREALERRKELLTTESIELLHVIVCMKGHSAGSKKGDYLEESKQSCA